MRALTVLNIVRQNAGEKYNGVTIATGFYDLQRSEQLWVLSLYTFIYDFALRDIYCFVTKLKTNSFWLQTVYCDVLLGIRC